MKTSLMIHLVIGVVFLSTAALASGLPAPQVIADHQGLFQWLLGGALLLNGFFITRTLKSIDRLWQRTDDMNSDLEYLKGQHKANHRES